jgi:ATP-dependent exoDNAse (exonuclease V) beta subunit
MPDPSSTTRPAPDQQERDRALDATRSILVRAPAGSGKTDLLTRRFLRLLAEVDDPGEIVAITFTKAAAAEMRHRILDELEKAAAQSTETYSADDSSMAALAARALRHSVNRGWNLIELPSQLRATTIDAFCREIALQRPLLSDLGGAIDIADHPRDLYRRAARHTLQSLGTADPALQQAMEALLLWRDNGWQDLEDQLVAMLEKRDQWMHEFVVNPAPDWSALRAQLEAPFQNAVRTALTHLAELFDRVPHALAEAHELARFACTQGASALFQELAELADFPQAPFENPAALEAARQASGCLANLLLTNDGSLRARIDKNLGFPKESPAEKNRLETLIADLRQVPGLEEALAAIRALPPTNYSDQEWRIVQSCFLLLRRAAAELRVVFAESATADYVEVAQIADSVLRNDYDLPGESALAMVDKIRHLLVDEFQDTSRKQHRLLASLIAAWPGREGRTSFVVGDPMQSIYSFRDADAELFPRVQQFGLEIGDELPFDFESVALSANFRTAAQLVDSLNEVFEKVFAQNDGSGVRFTPAQPARDQSHPPLAFSIHETPRPEEHFPLELHLEFVRESSAGKSRQDKKEIGEERAAAHERQVTEIVNLIRSHAPSVERARAENLSAPGQPKKKYRVAVLGRTRKALEPIAAALRAVGVPFRGVDLEPLRDRPEVLDALSLAHAFLNPQDRVAWLGVLRAPWCALALEDLHRLVSADDETLLARPVPDLLVERLDLLSPEPRAAVDSILAAFEFAQGLRAAQPSLALGTWLEQTWLTLGGAPCVDAAALANLHLLWLALDALPAAEQDLLGSALDAALQDLNALPDPAADEDLGVQLMTIHKAKGLEFEIVIVPEMQAATRHTESRLLSWLERGLAQPDEFGEPTELLVAPIAAKGADRGAAKKWVDSVRRDRERQELRRLLYVAASRAREQLHLFARPAYKTAKDGSLAIAEPREGLLATAWPAIKQEIHQRFAAWSTLPAASLAIAAAAEEPQAAIPPHRGTLLRRLPPGTHIPSTEGSTILIPPAVAGLGQLYERHEGGLRSRALGVAVHALLEEIARLRISSDWDAVRSALPRFSSRIAAQIRGGGIDLAEAASLAARALEIGLKATHDPNGAWILSPHIDAQSEARWAGLAAGSLRTVQMDRIFRAGAEPRVEGDSVWWIADFKTAHQDGLRPEEALPKLRRAFLAQLTAYAGFLRNLHGADARICAGLYYPRMLAFDWWEI